MKVRKTSDTRSPNLYHLKKIINLFKIVSINIIPQLSEEEREMAFGMLQVEIEQRELAKRFGHKIFVLLQCFNATNSTPERPMSGNPRVTSPTPPPRRPSTRRVF